jgi:hypothetical protein
VDLDVEFREDKLAGRSALKALCGVGAPTEPPDPAGAKESLAVD